MNFKLIIQYDGTEFHGWQIQEGLRTVQGELAAALSLIDGREVTIHGSGRTDAGVHAEGQVASVVLERTFPGEKLRAAINGNVGKDLRVLSAEPVPEAFHARYSAVEKTYVYRVVNGPVMSPFWNRYAYHEARQLDHQAMHLCVPDFLGEHDWTAFSAAQSDVTDRVRTIRSLVISEDIESRAQARMIQIEVTANGFLRYMVRSIAGALLSVGLGDLQSSEIRKAIETGQRPNAIKTAPACGLTLVNVGYG